MGTSPKPGAKMLCVFVLLPAFAVVGGGGLPLLGLGLPVVAVAADPVYSKEMASGDDESGDIGDEDNGEAAAEPAPRRLSRCGCGSARTRTAPPGCRGVASAVPSSCFWLPV